MEEKILRHFDLSSQYGVCIPRFRFALDYLHPGLISANVANPAQPCIGIARLRRWRRANKLKLNPPLEVLAVLLKNEEIEEKAHMDQLLS